MKKRFTVLALLLVLCVSAVNAKPLSGIINNSWAYYLDTRGGANYYRGFLFFEDGDDTVVYQRSINLDTNEQYVVVLFFSESDNDVQFLGSNGQFDMKNQDMMQLIPDILNFVSMKQLHKKEITYELKDFEDPWGDDYVLIYRFSSLIPGFGFTTIFKQGQEDDGSFTLNRWGICNTQADIQTFITYMPVEFKATDRNLSTEIPEAESVTVTMNGLKVTLDKNWTFEQTEEFSGYWLELSSIRDSQIMIEDARKIFDVTKFNNQCDIIKMIIASSQGIDPSSFSFSKNKDGLVCSYNTFDAQNLESYQRIQFKKGRIVNFSSFTDIYQANKDYYEKIVDSVK